MDTGSQTLQMLILVKNHLTTKILMIKLTLNLFTLFNISSNALMIKNTFHIVYLTLI